MRRGVLESGLNLLISVVIIVFIISLGYSEIKQYLINREVQLFKSDLNSLINNMNYLVETNSRGSFLQNSVKLPVNQSLLFNNETNNITLRGVINKNITLNCELVNELLLNNSGSYELTVCYDCIKDEEYMVRIN